MIATRELTGIQQRKLNDLETIIERGLQTFVEVGAALAIIREQELYRATHETFEGYCEERWGWTARRARQLITSAAVVESLGEAGNQFPVRKERHADAMADVPPEKRSEVWVEANESAAKPGKPTTREVRRAAAPYKPKKPKKVGPHEAAMRAAREAEAREPSEAETPAEDGRLPQERRTENPAPAGDTPSPSDEQESVARAHSSPAGEPYGTPDPRRLDALRKAESALAVAASFRGPGQAAVAEALELVRGMVEWLSKAEAEVA